MSSYNFKIDNTLQLKILNHKGTYHKASILRINSQFNYNPLLNSEQLTPLNTDIYINNLSSKNLFYINTKHDFYSKHKRELINILSGELPRLLSISIRTNMKLNLFGFLFNDINSNKTLDNKEIISNQNQTNKKTENKLWETNLNFDYNSSWKESNQTWNYDFNVITDNKINLSKKWTISHNAYFNIKKRELVYHSFKIYRPLHCWELSFDYWPMGGSAGFSLKINVKSPDLQDIKLTSTDNRR